jgi:hypothetical protein
MNEKTITEKRIIAGRKGGLAKRGKKSEKTLMREEAMRQYRARVLPLTNQLLNAQLSLALGQVFLFRISDTPQGSRKRVERVTDPNEIQAYFDGAYDESVTYYRITAKEPNAQAIEAILNRTYGKPLESPEAKTDEQIEPVSIVVIDPTTGKPSELLTYPKFIPPPGWRRSKGLDR